MRSIVYEEYNGKCFYCKQKVENNFHIDHKAPKYSGGTDKGVRAFDDFVQKLESAGLQWRDKEFRRVRLVYSNRHFLDNPGSIPRRPGVSNPYIGMVYKEKGIRRKARALR